MQTTRVNPSLQTRGSEEFQKEQIVVENIDCYYSSEEEWIECYWNTGYRIYFEQLSEKDFARMKDEIFDYLQIFKENGKIKITMSAFITKATILPLVCNEGSEVFQ